MPPAFSAQTLDKRRVAVLPFQNISPDPKDEYFADGLTEELISTISKIRELMVISRTSTMQYKTRSKPIAQISRELNSGTLLEGSVRKAGSKVRVTVQMIDAKHDQHLWSESYDRELQDIFAIQSDIAERVADALRVELLSAERREIERKPTESTEAYQLYLKGRYHWTERTRAGMDKALEYFEEAVKLDSNFALAFAGLADCFNIYGDAEWLEPKDAFPKAKEFALKAIEINPKLAEPHASLGLVYHSYEWKWEEAENEFKRAIELKPSYATGHQWYGLYLEFRGRVDEGYAAIGQAWRLDPLSRIIALNVGFAMMLKGEYKGAIAQLEKVRDANPKFANVHEDLSLTYYLNARRDDAIREMHEAVALSGGDAGSKAELACLLGLCSRSDEAVKLLEELKESSKTTYVSKVGIAGIHFALGQFDEGFNYLSKAYEERSITTNHGVPLLLPWFNEARNDPRWAALERRLGLEP